MAFRASGITSARAYDQARSIAIQVKTFSQTASDALSRNSDSTRLLNGLAALIGFKANLNAVKGVRGIVQYAKDQEDDQTYNVSAEFNALITAIDATIAEITSIFPVSNGFLLARSFNADGSLMARSFTASQVATVKAKFDAIIASVS